MSDEPMPDQKFKELLEGSSDEDNDDGDMKPQYKRKATALPLDDLKKTKLNGIMDIQEDEEVYQYWLSKVKFFPDRIQLHDAPDHIRCNRKFFMEAININSLALKFASPELQRDKHLVLTAFEKNSFAFLYASPELQNDKDFVMETVNINGFVLKFVSPELKRDKDVVLAAVQKYGNALEYASPELKNDKVVVMAAVQQDGLALKFASPQLQNDKHVVIKAIQENGDALGFASSELKNDNGFVTEAIRQHGAALKYAPPDFKNNKKVVLTAIQSEWDSFMHHIGRSHFDRNFVALYSYALDSCSSELLNEKEFILEVVQKYGLLLSCAPEHFRKDKEVVTAAVKQNVRAFQFASKELQIDKDVCKAYVQGHPSNIRYIPVTFRTDPEILLAAGQFHQGHLNKDTRIVKGTKKIVLSTRFSFIETSDSEATIFAAWISCHPYIQGGNFDVYIPNANNKQTCGDEKKWTDNWTDFNHPCRGTTDTCEMEDVRLKTGTPTDQSCWRYSFRNQLQEAATTKGFMLQLVESPDRFEEQTLGNGQGIELDMAKNHLKMKIFQVYRPVVKGSCEATFLYSHIEQVVTAIKRWYNEGCQDMDICVIKFSFDLLDTVGEGKIIRSDVATGKGRNTVDISTWGFGSSSCFVGIWWAVVVVVAAAALSNKPRS